MLSGCVVGSRHSSGVVVLLWMSCLVRRGKGVEVANRKKDGYYRTNVD